MLTRFLDPVRVLGLASAAMCCLALAACTTGPDVSETRITSSSPSPTSSATPTIEQAPARDLGPREHARGRVTKHRDGAPVEYRVAEDDNAGAICRRFERRWWQLTDEAGVPLGTYPMLQIGEVVGITNAPLTDYAGDGLSSDNALC